MTVTHVVKMVQLALHVNQLIENLVQMVKFVNVNLIIIKILIQNNVNFVMHLINVYNVKLLLEINV